MASVEVKSFDHPDESNSNFNNAQIDIVCRRSKSDEIKVTTWLEMVKRY